MNSDNKSQLVEVIVAVWSSDEFAPKLLNRRVYVVLQGHCYLLTSTDGQSVTKTEIPTLLSNQEETDTRVVLYSLYDQEMGYENVCIRTPDSDIFFILLHHAHKCQSHLIFDTGTGNKRRLISISKLADAYGPRLCASLLAFHAYTHCDSTSAF
jgi:hypothetical protein